MTEEQKKLQYWEWMMLSEDQLMKFERERTKLTPEEYYGPNPVWWEDFLDDQDEK